MDGHTTRSATESLVRQIAGDATAQGERRVITMLFADIIGSTAAAETLGPERWSQVMRDVFDRFIAPVERYEGSVARMLGDAILAYFGAPVAHEDDPQRAILAALDMLEATRTLSAELHAEHGIGLNIRIGINTGLVIVGEVGSEMYSEYAALGDAANIAARMEQTAAPGTIQVAEATYRLTAPLFDFEHVGDLEIKGKDDLVSACRAIGVSANPGRLRGIEGLESPMVGRDVEILQTSRVLEEVAAGSGQIASLIAEAGLGKSRLAEDMRLRAESVGVRWLEGASYSYDTITPFAPAITLVRQCVGITDADDPGEQRANINAALARHPADTNRLDAVTLSLLVGAEVDDADRDRLKHMLPPQIREATIASVARHIEATATDGPLTVVFEDLHWADPASIALVERLLAATDRVPLLVLALFRPRRDEPAWSIHETAQREYPHRYTSVQLKPLTTGQSQDLIANLLKVEGLHTTVREAILNKAEGNPFFVEEVVRSLIDNGTIRAEGDRYVADATIEAIAVPDTLSSVIATRLDRLEPAAKRLLQSGSVIGREFDLELISLLTDPTLDTNEIIADLLRRELITQTQTVPTRAFAFKHALTMDTAYASLLGTVKVELHRGVGELLEERHPDRVIDLGRHFTRAEEPERAIPYLVASGDKMSAAYSMLHAIDAYREALRLASATTPTEDLRRAYEGLANAHLFSADIEATFATYQEMQQFGESREHPETVVSAMNKAGFARLILENDFVAAEELVTGAMAIAEDAGDRAGLAECHISFCNVNTLQGRLDKAAGHLEDMFEVGEEIGSEAYRVFAIVHHTNTLLLRLKLDEAREMADKARDLAETFGQRDQLAHLIGGMDSWLLAAEGDTRGAYALSQKGVEITEEISSVVHRTFILPFTAHFARMLGRYEESARYTDDCQELSEAIGNHSSIIWARANRILIDVAIHGVAAAAAAAGFDDTLEELTTVAGGVYTGIVLAELAHLSASSGDLEAANRSIELALTHDGTTKLIGHPSLLQCQAAIALMGGDVDTALKHAREAEDIIESAGVGWLRPRQTGLDAGLAALNGDMETAHRDFAIAGTQARSAGHLPDALDNHRFGAALFDQLGDSASAANHRKDAARLIDEIANIFDDADLQDSYIATNSVGL